MTEDEANTRWCPILGLSGAILRSSDGQRKCIGSGCMMWRWRISPHDCAEMNALGNADTVADGYCGLGGR